MNKLSNIKEELQTELTSNILPYWQNNMIDHGNGGFYGRISGQEVLYPKAEKGAINNARILWTFSAAYRVLKKEEYLKTARRAKDYILQHFIDHEYGGVYWSLDYKGQPLDRKKQIYAIAFAIYGLSEYSRATGDKAALDTSISLFHSIEEHAFDKEKNGYIEALSEEWKEIKDMRLSDKDANERKTMNIHLHILESYTNLYRIWPDEILKKQIKNLLTIFIHKIKQANNHLGLFFNDDWVMQGSKISFGHDIESSWLLLETAEVLCDDKLYETISKECYKIATAALEGYTKEGSMINEKLSNGLIDGEKNWWVQAETVAGLFYLYKYHHKEEALSNMVKSWNYIRDNIIDHKHGGWYWSRTSDGKINYKDDKAGFWKCPYHNSRMCLKIINNYI